MNTEPIQRRAVQSAETSQQIGQKPPVSQVMPKTLPEILWAFRGPRGRLNSTEHVQNVTRFRIAIITSALLHILFDSDTDIRKSVQRIENRLDVLEQKVGVPTVREFRIMNGGRQAA